MNERIKELAEQAFCYACEFAQGSDYNPHNPYNQATHKNRYDSKFAELIVKECAGSIAGFRGWTNGVELGQLIKQHFGVEE